MGIDDEFHAFIEHHGIKGMKWGVRNEDKPTGDTSAKKTDGETLDFSEQEKAVIRNLTPHGYTEERMRKMYGPGSPSGPPVTGKESFHLTDGQKKALKIGAGVAVAGVALYGLNRLGQKKLLDMQLGENAPDALKEFWRDSQLTKVASEGKGYSKDYVNKLSTEAVHLSAGSILKRVSTEKELDIKPGGFFAAYKDADVGRYKAVLPIYWKAWGYNNKEGYVVNLRAKEDVKAPSPRQTFDMFVDFLKAPSDIPGTSNRDRYDYLIPKAFNSLKPEDDESFARRVFHGFSGNWNDNSNKLTDAFFGHVKGQGYNALVDMNDAGSLGDTPLRLLDGNMFEIAGHEILSASDINRAQQAVLEIAHAAMALLSHAQEAVMTVNDDMNVFLEHFGIKGMKWGVRKESGIGVSKKIEKDASKDAAEFARAKAFHGEGAGTRRKLIKQTVESKSKNPDYKKAFDHHLGQQDQAKHVQKAVSERKRIDRTTKTKQRAGFIARKFTGEMGTQAAFTAAALGGAAFLASPKGRRMMNNVMAQGRGAANRVVNDRRRKQGADFLNDYFSRNG